MVLVLVTFASELVDCVEQISPPQGLCGQKETKSQSSIS